jgi:hypothetical protein
LRIAWSRSEDASLEHPSQGLQSVQRKATKERQIASAKRLLKTWPVATGNVPRNAKNKGSAIQNSKKAAEEGIAHIDGMLGGIQNNQKLIDLERS